jgi:putative ABC transport system substrate-binding protein
MLPVLTIFPRIGLLIAYGPDFADMYRRCGIYAASVLQGVKTADLPIERPTRFELVINRRTATALGLLIPPSLLLRADQVIE